ncbi:MAG: WG repeat-containing protein [Saprospiraceae bacterium]|nr:WG repeat-containing protein [Saprospiraceae bacterium]
MKIYYPIITLFIISCIWSCKKSATHELEVNRYPVQIGKRYGYIDEQGKVVIEPTFYSVGWFNQNRAVAELEPGQKVMIDTNGIIIFQDTSGYLRDVFSDGLIRFDKKNGVSCFIDSLGQERFCLSDTLADSDAYFSGERLRVRFPGRRFAFLDTQGKVAFELKQGFPSPFYDDLAIVGFSGRTCYVNKSGHRKFCIKERGSNFSGDLALVFGDQTSYFIDKKGRKKLTKLSYDSVTPFINGFAAVTKNGKTGFINTKGKEVIPTKYKEVLYFINNSVAVKSDNKWIFLNHYNEKIITQHFDEVTAPGFVGELAYVRLDSTWGYINKKGQFVWKTETESSK